MNYVQKDFHSYFILHFQSFITIFANHILSPQNFPLLDIPNAWTIKKISNTRVFTNPFRIKMTTEHQQLKYGLCSKGFRVNFIFDFQTLITLFAYHVLSPQNVPQLKFPEFMDD
jgi:hypothetical protein